MKIKVNTCVIRIQAGEQNDVMLCDDSVGCNRMHHLAHLDYDSLKAFMETGTNLW